MKKIIFLIFFFILQNSFCQVTFIIDNLPENIPKKASVYISGDFEGWTGGQEKFKLKVYNNKYLITIPETGKTIQFKFTLGSWETVETGKKGENIVNRNYTFHKKNDTVNIVIQNWSSSKLKKSTTTKNVSVLSEDFFIPQLNRNRRIWIYLPPDYESSKKSYPVMYMHDGQNLFDTTTSYSGEWEIDETLDKLYKESGFGLIAIGIDNGGDHRLDEYSPWENKKYGGGEGSAYVDFIVKTLKPYIDKNYRTKSDKENTAIMGSSMGGLISYYAGLKYPDLFTKTGVFSPSFWFSDKSFDYAKAHGNQQNLKMYFLAGGKEGDNVAFSGISKTAEDLDKMMEILKKEGFNPQNINSKVVPDGKHNEKLWRENFEETVLWLFEE